MAQKISSIEDKLKSVEETVETEPTAVAESQQSADDDVEDVYCAEDGHTLTPEEVAAVGTDKQSAIIIGYPTQKQDQKLLGVVFCFSGTSHRGQVF